MLGVGRGQPERCSDARVAEPLVIVEPTTLSFKSHRGELHDAIPDVKNVSRISADGVLLSELRKEIEQEKVIGGHRASSISLLAA
jgi:hypothetical protein